jgi:hypothetical protein
MSRNSIREWFSASLLVALLPGASFAQRDAAEIALTNPMLAGAGGEYFLEVHTSHLGSPPPAVLGTSSQHATYSSGIAVPPLFEIPTPPALTSGAPSGFWEYGRFAPTDRLETPLARDFTWFIPGAGDPPLAAAFTHDVISSLDPASGGHVESHAQHDDRDVSGTGPLESSVRASASAEATGPLVARASAFGQVVVGLAPGTYGNFAPTLSALTIEAAALLLSSIEVRASGRLDSLSLLEPLWEL